MESEDMVEDRVAEVDIMVDHHLQVLEVVATEEVHRLDHLEVEDMVEDRVRVEKVDTKEVEVVTQNEDIMVDHHLQVLEVVATEEVHRLDHLEVEDIAEVRVHEEDLEDIVEVLVEVRVVATRKMLHHEDLEVDIVTTEIAMDDHHQLNNNKKRGVSLFFL